MNMAVLWWEFLFSTIGLGYFVHGKRQRAPVPLLCGLALMVFPYFVSSSWATVLMGAALMGIAYFVRL